ncbi:claudin-4-like [Paramisgurnus dabryanus]|uniref:claudin-4-like n=1 Tax=Paramisgurnus dabryanus TaxID=90735 RepID=UPI0031F46F8B
MEVVKSKKLGLGLATLGVIGAIVSCALPKWKVSGRLSTVAKPITKWEGIWERCEDSTGEKQCENQDSMTLSSDLQAARALCIVVIVMGVLGIFFFIVGAVGAMCCDRVNLYVVQIISGGTLICAAILLLIPVCWVALNTIKAIFNPVTSPGIIEAPKQLGASLWLGFASSALLFGGGSLLCCSRLPDRVRTVVQKAANELLSQAT